MDIEGAEIEVIASLNDDLIKRVGQWTRVASDGPPPSIMRGIEQGLRPALADHISIGLRHWAHGF
jgi:hypothetical protein